MATIDGIGLEEPSTITKSLAAIPIERNSSITYQEVMVIGDPDSTTSSAVAKVTNAAAGSTAWGLVVRPVMPLTVAQSTAGDLQVTATQNSTAWSVLARVTTSSGGGVEGSTTTPVTGALGLHVRPLHPILVTAGSTQGSGSTSSTLVSSNANSLARVVAYSVTSTEAGPLECGFYAGNTLLWPVLLWADGGRATAEMAVPHPSYIFSGSTGAPLEWRQGSTGHVRLAITYWTGA